MEKAMGDGWKMWKHCEKCGKNVENCGKMWQKCGKLWENVENCGNMWKILGFHQYKSGFLKNISEWK